MPLGPAAWHRWSLLCAGHKRAFAGCLRVPLTVRDITEQTRSCTEIDPRCGVGRRLRPRDCVTTICWVAPGDRVIVGDQAADCFGLANTPVDRSPSPFTGGRTPADLGLDADQSVLGLDGRRGWALNARSLSPGSQ